MKNYLFSLLLPTTLISCDSKLSDPQAIVDKTIEVSGGAKYQKSVVEFDFRDRHYIARRDGGAFSYERIFEDTTGTVHDYVTNNGFRREINGEEVVVPDSMATKYTSSTNSVNYFALLPYGLNDPAVNKTFLGETEIEGKQYYKIKVTFSADGGGEDFEDEFLYWINQETFTMDYLAYSFEESDEVSFRFRVGYNPRIVNGIRVQDYVNYKPENNTLKVDQAEELYKAGKLIELSRIEMENVTVE
ncbi:MAG TPA: hypothetical protein P5280_07080 [Cyclobacteriaceae bacterium]|nr:hypothetical protein [Cyclobacteriaceae bacterium]